MQQQNVIRESNFLRVPSFSWGVSRILDVEGSARSFYISSDGLETDAFSIARDWFAVGDDIWFAVEKEKAVISSR